ncbi:hypothetical protein YC2023_099229 [Brassica napus]
MCSMLHPSSHKHQNCYIESSGGLPTHSPSRLRWKAKRITHTVNITHYKGQHSQTPCENRIPNTLHTNWSNRPQKYLLLPAYKITEPGIDNHTLLAITNIVPRMTLQAYYKCVNPVTYIEGKYTNNRSKQKEYRVGGKKTGKQASSSMEHRWSSDLRSGTFRSWGVQIRRRIRHQRPLNHPRSSRLAPNPSRRYLLQLHLLRSPSNGVLLQYSRQRRRGSRAGEKHPERTAISYEEPPTPKPYFAIGDERGRTHDEPPEQRASRGGRRSKTIPIRHEIEEAPPKNDRSVNSVLLREDPRGGDRYKLRHGRRKPQSHHPLRTHGEKLERKSLLARDDNIWWLEAQASLASLQDRLWFCLIIGNTIIGFIADGGLISLPLPLCNNHTSN